jgi:group II intron reverse transcriptase/maturase/CRISPR-associated endonuclease Cas1
MIPLPNVSVILGPPGAVDIALRKALRFATEDGASVILDFSGRGAMTLEKIHTTGFDGRSVIWCDLADRRRPVSFFRLATFPGVDIGPIISRLLYSFSQIAGITISGQTLQWAAGAASRLALEGTIGLGAMLRTLSSSETRSWFVHAGAEPEDYLHLLEILFWALRYPAIFGASESINRINLNDIIANPRSLVWLECQSEHFEKCEHQLLVRMVYAAVEHALMALVGKDKKSTAEKAKSRACVFHLYPPLFMGSDLPAWIVETAPQIRHVAVHLLEPDKAPAAPVMSWITKASLVCVAGQLGHMKTDAHSCWLTLEQIQRIARLQAGELWVKKIESNQELTVKTATPAASHGLVHHYRKNAAKSRKLIAVRQMSAAVNAIAGNARGSTGLYRKLLDKESLRIGWVKVRSGQKSSAGSDGVTIGHFADHADEELETLSVELSNGAYRCRPLRRFYIAKNDGGKRPISLVCVRDRVVQTACLALLEPLFEPIFSRFSFGFRHGRNAHQAIALTKSRIKAGANWAVIADIKKCFDSIDHDILLRLLAKEIADSELLNLIRHWLAVDVFDFQELLPVITGVPQGESLSPFFANIYLTPLDNHFEKLGFQFIRYADDIIVLEANEESAANALHAMEVFVQDRLGLSLKPAKTYYVPIASGFDFLGFRINDQFIEIMPEKLTRVVKEVEWRLRSLKAEGLLLKEKLECLTRINAVVRGFRNYFELPDEPHIVTQLAELDNRLDALADTFLDGELKNEVFWQCRERFLVHPGNPDAGSAGPPPQPLPAAAGYPVKPAAYLPESWMVKNNRRCDDPVPSSADAKPETAGPLPLAKAETNSDTGIIEHNRRLYVIAHGSFLTVDADDLVIKKKKSEIFRSGLDRWDLIFIQGFGITTAVSLQLKLAECGVPLVVAPAHGTSFAVLSPSGSPGASLRRQQILKTGDIDVVSAGLEMLACKVGNQAAVLKYFAKYRKKTNPAAHQRMIGATQEMQGLAGQIRSLDPGNSQSIISAMGYEGRAAALYWQQIKLLVPKEFDFTHRLTRNATDRINQCLNYVYGLLYGETWRAVIRAGLDPYFGIVHGQQKDQGSLVFDLIEEFRAPFADRVVLGLLGRGFRPLIGRFDLLQRRTRRILTTGFFKRWLKKGGWRAQKINAAGILEKQAIGLSRLFKGEGTYKPYRMPW